MNRSVSLKCSAVGIAAFMLIAANTAFAKVSQEEAKKLGSILTSIGADPSANASGSIPAYDPSKVLDKPFGNYKPKHAQGGYPYVDPYANEKPIYSITSANVGQYSEYLTDLHKLLFERYSDYRMDVYPTHRSAAFPKFVYDRTKQCATTAELVDNGLSFAHAHACIPFPIPSSGAEVMWNTMTSYGPTYEEGETSSYMYDAKGGRTMVAQARFQYERPFWDPTKGEGEYLYMFRNAFTKPANKVGELTIIHRPIPYAKPDVAWSYTPGQRRVRLAPEFKYDTVMSNFGGVYNYDEIWGWDGKMDRFDFKLVGKKELLVPYNAYDFLQHGIDDVAGPHFPNPQHLRWEQHRVWVVEATVKPGVRHMQSKKTIYVDEDSWKIISYDGYDKQGKLMRGLYRPMFVMQDVPMLQSVQDVVFNITNGTWALTGQWFPDSGFYPSDAFVPNHFNPAAMAGSGVR